MIFLIIITNKETYQEVKKSCRECFQKNCLRETLNSYNEHATVHSDVARTEFYWVFDATFKNDNSPLQTKGRESQIWRKIGNE